MTFWDSSIKPVAAGDKPKGKTREWQLARQTISRTSIGTSVYTESAPSRV